MRSSEDGRGVNTTEKPELSSNTPAIDDIDLPPNGGFNAWLQVLGSFFLFFNSW